MCLIMKQLRFDVNELLADVADEILVMFEQSQKTRGENIKVFIKERLVAAAEEILAGFKRAIREYQQEIDRYRLQDPPCIIEGSKICLFRPDQQQLFVCKKEWSPSLDQEELESQHIKEELWSSQEGDPLQGLEEADVIKFTVNPVIVKIEDDEENQSSKLHPTQTEDNGVSEPLASMSKQMKMEADGKDCRVSEAARNLDPAWDLEPSRECQPLSSDWSETESETEIRNGDWKETRPPRSLNTMKPQKTQRDKGQKSVRNKFRRSEEAISCSVCKSNFSQKSSLKTHMRLHTGERTFSCIICKKYFTKNSSRNTHMRLHTGERPFKCTICKKDFTEKSSLKKHMRIHTREKPFSCTVCKKDFTEKSHLTSHMRCHTGEKPFSCPVCKKDFREKSSLKTHMRLHTGERPFRCPVCKQGFNQKICLNRHMKCHTGE